MYYAITVMLLLAELVTAISTMHYDSKFVYMQKLHMHFDHDRFR